MKKYLKISLFALVAFTTIILSCSQEKSNEEKFDCEDFKTGEFTYGKDYEFEGKKLQLPKEYNLDTMRFTRKDNIHHEYYHEEGKYAIYEIKWYGNCSYDLKLLESTTGVYESGDIINTKIVSRSDTSYNFISKSKHGEIKGTIIKFK